MLPRLLLFFASPLLVAANVEKVVFLGSEPVTIPLASPSLPDLHLHVLTPENPSIRTNLTRVFPAEPGNAALGQPAWVLLDNLTESQRYEFRVCWAAIEPTSFDLDVYDLNTVWETPELIQSLATYSYSRQAELSDEQEINVRQETAERSSSVKLLLIKAAADYYTDNQQLMKNPPPVLVDLILDPYVLNAVPQSLLPTVGYLIFVAGVTWFLARRIATWLQTVAQSPEGQEKKQI